MLIICLMAAKWPPVRPYPGQQKVHAARLGALALMQATVPPCTPAGPCTERAWSNPHVPWNQQARVNAMYMQLREGDQDSMQAVTHSCGVE